MGKSDSGSSDEAKDGLKKGPWSAEEDQKLIDYIKKHGYGRWRTLPKNAGLRRCGKSCRLRWTNYLRPDIKRGSFTAEEEDAIIHLHSILGNKWSSIAARLPGRTDNEIKNYWNTHIKKRLYKMGIDPVTHTPCTAGPLELSPFISQFNPNLDLLRMLGSDIDLSSFADAHFFPRTKMEETVSPQETLLNCSDEFQSHIQSLLASHHHQLQNQTLMSGHQNVSPNPNPFTNSWHSENDPIANSGDFGSFQSIIEADKTYLCDNAKYDVVSTSMPNYGSSSSSSYVNSIM